MYIHISVAQQHLTVWQDQCCIFQAPACTAKNGVGEQMGSECTPRGKHYIRAKIGVDQSVNSVFIGRRPTGEIFDQQLYDQYPQRDWILTRILWLCGLELGKNRGGKVDTMRRYIYIHGSAPQRFIDGKPMSRGCICLHNDDLMYLFDLVPVYTSVMIEE